MTKLIVISPTPETLNDLFSTCVLKISSERMPSPGPGRKKKSYPRYLIDNPPFPPRVDNCPAPMLSHKPAVALYQPDVAEHMTLEAGNLVFSTNTGVLKLERVRENPDYQKVH